MLTVEYLQEQLEKVKSGEASPQKARDYALLCVAIENMQGKPSASPVAATLPLVSVNTQPEKKAAPTSRETVEKAICMMENADGTSGPRWTMEQAKNVQAQKHIGGSPFAFWAALNYVYGQYGEVARKMGVNFVDFCANMAQSMLAGGEDFAYRQIMDKQQTTQNLHSST